MQTFLNTTNPDYKRISMEFVKIYYDRMSKGLNTAFELFNPNVMCTVDSEEFSGSYTWLQKMTTAGISRFEYYNVIGVCHALTNFEILINTQGNMKAINLWGHYSSNWLKFTETFVLTRNGDNYSIRNYILRIY